MNIIIDNYDFWNMEAMKYWTQPKTKSASEKRKEVKNLILSGSFYGSVKVDGAWQMIIKDMDGNYHARSRTESVNGGYADKADWLPQITKELSNVPNGTVLLGEIYLPNDEGSRKITSVFNCLLDKSLERQKKKPLHYYVFDILAIGGKSLMTYEFKNRIGKLKELNLMLSEPEYIQIAEYKKGEELWDLYGEAIETGREGVVITRDGSLYLPGKRKARETVKLKKELQDTIDAFLDGGYRLPTKAYNGKQIESWEFWINVKTNEKVHKNMFAEYIKGEPYEPVSKAYFHNWASAVSFSVYKDGQPVQIGWISGITDQLKEEIISNPRKWIGKVAELTAMEVQFVNNEYSLRHGKIFAWRDDKKPKDCDFSQITG